MRRHAISEPASELTFEPPPRLPWPAERRLSERAVALWETACEYGRPPAAAGFSLCELAISCGASSIGIVAAADEVTVSSVGEAVAAVFGLVPGKLGGTAIALAAQLGWSFAELRRSGAPVSFEAGLTGSRNGSSLLTRGVLMPLLDDDGLLTQATAIVTWKELLDTAASNQLNGELSGAMAAGRAVQSRPGARLPSALETAFAAVPSARCDDAAASWLVRRQ